MNFLEVINRLLGVAACTYVAFVVSGKIKRRVIKTLFWVAILAIPVIIFLKT